MFTNEVSIIVVSCASGCAPFLEQELLGLGMKVTWRGDTAVETEGTLTDTMRLNLYLRTAHRVFYMLGGFAAADPDELYDNLLDIPWEKYINPLGYFTVDVSVDTPTIRNDLFAALRVKDAVADYFREREGMRPDSGNEVEGVTLFLHWTGEDAAIYINTSGAALSRRGYRIESNTAPMRESLAAALVLASGWDALGGHFLNPMCGGGTLAIEAALIASNRPPALLRNDFTFMHLVGFDNRAWRELRQEAIANIRKALPCRIIASDIDGEAIAATRANAEAAGVAELIEYDIADFALSPVPEAEPEKEVPEGSVIILNPPYGSRMGDVSKLRATYAAIGAFLKRHAERYRGFIFTASPELAEEVGLQAKQELPFFAGALEARLIEYGGFEKRRGIFRDETAMGS